MHHIIIIYIILIMVLFVFDVVIIIIIIVIIIMVSFLILTNIRWGHTPLVEAEREGHSQVIKPQ